MAGDLSHNFLEPNDVNDDNRISPVDALLVINTLNDHRSSLTSTHAAGFHDVNDDSRVSPIDALLVINQLNANRDPSTSSPTGAILNHIEAKIESSTSSATAKIEFEESSAEKELSIKVRDAAASTSYSVKLNDIALGELLTDAKGRGKLVFSVGDDNDSHQPWPANLPPLTMNTELIIGDIVRGKLSGNSDDSATGGNTGESAGGDNGGGANGGGNSTGGSSSSQSSGAWIATVPAVGSLSRKAEFETESEGGETKSKLEVEIEGAAAGATYSIKVGDFEMEQVVASSKGKAKVVWSTQPRDGELALSSGFPNISDSISVTIGDATAKFVKM